MFLFELAGEYAGTNHLILDPAEPPRVSDANASVVLASRGKVVRLDYTWDDNGPQEGMLLIGAPDGREGVLAAWTDSWHMGKKLLICNGDVDARSIRLLGTFTSVGAGGPPGPDWGWRILLEPVDDRSFTMRMFVIAPDSDGSVDGDGDLAVEVRFNPVNGS